MKKEEMKLVKAGEKMKKWMLHDAMEILGSRDEKISQCIIFQFKFSLGTIVSRAD